MSISIESLSLLGSLAPLRHKSDTSGIPQGNGFADKLDKALGDGESPAPSASGSARELAESLTLQMLQSSLSLGGDSSSDSATSTFSQLPSTKALLHAYQSNRATNGESSSSVPASPVSPLQDVASSAPVAAAVVPSLQVRTNATWLDPIISRASQKYGVDAGLIRAVIKAESNFNPQAVSHAGARGLMQLMPATARSLGVTDSFDPEQNVMGGTRFLKDMLQRYNGDVDAALAAYNWGPGNVDKRPDRLPHETRDYLARVKQLYASYTG
jgi:soluble lytic murein transglycosylase-like protein